VSIFDLHSWFGSPAIYVFDCSAAGVLFDAFNQILSTVQSVNSDGSNSQFTKGSSMPDLSGVMNSDSHVNSDVPLSDANGLSSPYSRNDINPDLLHDIIALGACSAHEILPMNPELPADVFTSCLTTPIQIALRWFASNSFLCEVTPDDTDKLPGKPNDRKSPLGEMNWIFTAVTDTIAWNVLPPSLFQRLFRQDLLVASIFRNYLLAERMMRSFNCTPVSIPKLSETYQHPMWESWDLAAEFCLSQLAKLLRNEINESMFESCSFFSDQLTTFEIWLEFANEILNLCSCRLYFKFFLVSHIVLEHYSYWLVF
jgi:regulator-associated protein of mTOR